MDKKTLNTTEYKIIAKHGFIELANACRASGLNEEQTKKMLTEAYEKFINESFGVVHGHKRYNPVDIEKMGFKVPPYSSVKIVNNEKSMNTDKPEKYHVPKVDIMSLGKQYNETKKSKEDVVDVFGEDNNN